MDADALLKEMRTLTTRLAELEHEMELLRSRTPSPSPPTAPEVGDKGEAPEPPDEAGSGLVDRRRLLSRGGAVAIGAALGGVAATVATAGPAAAATGSFDSSDATPALTATNTSSGPAIQATSSAGSAIKITGTGGVAIEAASTNSSTIKASSTGGRVLEISSTSVAPAVAVTQQEGIAAVAVDAAGVSIGVYSEGRDFGIYGESAGANGNGTAGRSIGGIAGVAGQGEEGAYGVAAYALGGVGLATVGGLAQMKLGDGSSDPAMAPPRTRVDAHATGEIYFDDDQSLWLCVADGTPGTWVRLAGAATAGAFTALPTPVRVFDTRPGSGKPGAGTGPISGTRHGIALTANSSGLPVDASAAMVTMTVTNTQANPAAYGQIYPDALVTPPATSVINWTAANTVIATTTTTGLTNGKVAVTIAPGANVILDLIGYWR